jgi:2-polyprenyl-3-methyl-5-hydroxy-6-metoxy-1,4-benzoquinol methylase
MINSRDYDICPDLRQSNTSYIYGEVNNESFSEILYSIFSHEDKESLKLYKFLDIGSGCGRLCTFLQNKYDFFVSGIEIDRQRYQTSINNGNETDKLEFICNNFSNVHFGEYDILYCCNTVFEDEDNDALYKKIIREFKGICFLFNYDKNMLPYYKDEFVIKTSWALKTPLYLFIL